jgi:hypothetical protein
MDRKTFLYRLMRGGMLASLALVAGILLARKQVSPVQECGLELRCRECSKLKKCRLPEAEKERRVEYKRGYEKR